MADNFNFLYKDELTVLKLRKLYEDKGFKKFRMSKFESYDFYAKNKDFRWFYLGSGYREYTIISEKIKHFMSDNAGKAIDRAVKLCYISCVKGLDEDICVLKDSQRGA